MSIARGIDTLILHCAATPNGKPFSIAYLDRWHRERGFKRRPEAVAAHRPHLGHVGYHYVITLDGIIHEGRALDETGAHAAGHNAHSIGLCLIGTDMFTSAQWYALKLSVLGLRLSYPGLRVIGHHEVNPVKVCPGFDVQAWLARRMEPAGMHIIKE